ncbi:glycosyltransferase family 25 protein [Noviherbaspirillum soli]|uniref:glycosyltransferase family 25 protein n=1 Tax=Noviherbaspirillum soli TaxID=1064518 RepID=UPI00188AC0FF|nr:glycosyltransferase family 25 protein [Noviherbaspirillum soli]
MECHYINLDSAVERRSTLEANFARCRREGWELKRFVALDEATAEKNKIPGKRSWREKGCFLSHKSLIEQQPDDGRSFVVLEDDAQFGLTSLEVIEGVLAENRSAQWDLLFTDINPLRMETMMMLALNRSQLMERRTVIPLDLAKIPFIGATAYVVNGASRRKLLAYLEAGVPVDTEYDVYLNHGMVSGELKAAALFPFITTLSEHSTKTQIQSPNTTTANMARAVFRRMMWLESSEESYNADLATVESRLQGTLHGKIAMLAGAEYFED